IASEIYQRTSETMVSYRKSRRYVHRLILRQKPEVNPLTQDVSLHMEGRGTFEVMEFKNLVRKAPLEEQVEIKIEATALNFRDVLTVLGLYPGNPGEPGKEVSGVITAVGSQVTEFKVGDRVVSMLDGGYSTYALAPVLTTKKIPDEMT